MNNDKHLNDVIIDQDRIDLDKLKVKQGKSGLDLLAQEALQRRVDEKDHLSSLRKYHGFGGGDIPTEGYKQRKAADDKLIDAYRESKRLPNFY